MKKHRPVLVLDCNDKQLHSTKNFAHVRHLLKRGKAVRICNNPFTIKLQKKV